MTAQAVDTEALLESIGVAIRENRLSDARQILDHLPNAGQEDARVWGLRARLAFQSGDLPTSLKASKQAVQLAPGNAGYMVQQARYHCLAGELEQARQLASEAERAGITHEDDFVMLGSLLVRCEAHKEALHCFERALAINPENMEAHRGLASVQRFFGRSTEAEAACDFVLALNPLDAEIHNLRSSLRRQTAERNHIRELLEVVKLGRLDWRGAVQVAYALAKEYEDLQEWDKSFYHLENGARIKRMNTRYDLHDDLRIFSAIEKAFARYDTLEPPEQACENDSPIFIVGMPRTGSTLVERIISSHSAVVSAGELNDFALALVAMVDRNRGETPDRLVLPSAALDLSMKELGDTYIASTAKRAAGAVRFIDKLPLNFLYLGYIHLALPNARIVHVRRDPMDACYAMYKFLFNQAYPFSYDLRETGEYYAAYFRLMAFWRKLLPPGTLIEVSYEALVKDQEAETRRLIGALGLDWEQNCLEFHTNPAAATTGSASQVRQKIYDSSVGRWRRYERGLKPLADTLRQHSIC